MGFFSARVSYRIARPKKVIIVRIERMQRGHLAHDETGDFPTFRQGAAQCDPERHYARLSVLNAGRRPITTADFEEGSPLEIDLGAQVIHVGFPISENRFQRSPGVRLHPELSGVLRFGPGLLNVGQKVLIHVVTLGKAILHVQGALVDVEWRTTKHGRVARRNAGVVILGALLLGFYVDGRYIIHANSWEAIKFWKYAPLFNIHLWIDAWKSAPLAVIVTIVLLILIGACFEVISSDSN